MVQGTTSDAGKSTVVTGLARALHRRGLSVAPFKPQNMALNSAVSADGGEIGRAQAVQAQACGLAPHTDMNPVLLKPESDTGSQVIVNGRATGTLDARAYHAHKPTLMPAILEAFNRLQARHQRVLIEGAGSPAEINLRENDLANMGFAEAADTDVVLVADIDKGGVFAHLYGTVAVLEPSEQARIKGFIINRFRGDIALLEPGLDWLEAKTGIPVLGVLPFLEGFHLEAEDAVNASQRLTDATLRVVVPRFRRISNHTDFDPLRLHPRVDLQFVQPGQPLPPADLVILPGTKSTRADLAFLRKQGWDADLARHLRYGGKVLGICGGYQMLGQCVSDPNGVEGAPGDTAGLGMLDVETTMLPDKALINVTGTLSLNGETASIDGYEIHVGDTTGPGLAHPLIALDDGRTDGVASSDGQVLGSYLHGLFEHPASQAALLTWAGLDAAAESVPDYRALRDAEIDRLADSVEAHLDWARLAPLLNVDAAAFA